MGKIKESVAIIKVDGTWEYREIRVERWNFNLSKADMMEVLGWFRKGLPEDVIDVVHICKSNLKKIKGLKGKK